MIGHLTERARESTAPALLNDVGVRFTQYGLEFSRELSRDEWITIGQRLAVYVNGTQWAIGDWLVYGAGMGRHGSKYDDAASITGLGLEYLSQMARLSSEYGLKDRIRGVSWTHHREALRVSDGTLRRQMLAAAAKNRWSRQRLADEIDDLQQKVITDIESQPEALAARDRTQVRRWHSYKKQLPKSTIVCPSCGHRWQTRRSSEASSADVRPPLEVSGS